MVLLSRISQTPFPLLENVVSHLGRKPKVAKVEDHRETLKTRGRRGGGAREPGKVAGGSGGL